MRQFLPTLILVLSVPQPGAGLRGQTIPGSTPTAEDCKLAADALAAGGRDDTTWGRLPACGPSGGKTLAAAFRGAARETDADYLARLYRGTSSIRDPEVFSAALAVMKDPAASGPARATAVLVAYAQHDRGLQPRIDIKFADLINGRDGDRCPLLPTSGAEGYMSESPLPADYLQQLAAATEEVAKSSAAKPARSFAKCIRRSLKVSESKPVESSK